MKDSGARRPSSACSRGYRCHAQKPIQSFRASLEVRADVGLRRERSPSLGGELFGALALAVRKSAQAGCGAGAAQFGAVLVVVCTTCLNAGIHEGKTFGTTAGSTQNLPPKQLAWALSTAAPETSTSTG